MTTIAIRLLVVAAFAVTLLGAQRSLAGAPIGCCVCECAGLATQCVAADSPTECGALCPQVNASCQESFSNSTCTTTAACAAGAPAAAPSLDATGLAGAVVLLSGLAALRLRRDSRGRRH